MDWEAHLLLVPQILTAGCRYPSTGRRVGGSATPQAWNTLPTVPPVSVRSRKRLAEDRKRSSAPVSVSSSTRPSECRIVCFTRRDGLEPAISSDPHRRSRRRERSLILERQTSTVSVSADILKVVGCLGTGSITLMVVL